MAGLDEEEEEEAIEKDAEVDEGVAEGVADTADKVEAEETASEDCKLGLVPAAAAGAGMAVSVEAVPDVALGAAVEVLIDTLLILPHIKFRITPTSQPHMLQR